MNFLEKQKAIRLVQEIHPDLLLHLSEEDLAEILEKHESGVDVKKELLPGFGEATLRMTGREGLAEEAPKKKKKPAKAVKTKDSKKVEVEEAPSEEAEVVVEPVKEDVVGEVAVEATEAVTEDAAAPMVEEVVETPSEEKGEETAAE